MSKGMGLKVSETALIKVLDVLAMYLLKGPKFETGTKTV